MNFSGKMGEMVFVDSNRYDPHTRKRPKAGSKKNQVALKQNYKRTALLNKLASDINRIVQTHNERRKRISIISFSPFLFLSLSIYSCTHITGT